MYKIGFIGNGCTGKTTSAFSLITQLKYDRALVGYCNDACRFITFDPNEFDTNPAARLHVLFKQMTNECEQLTRKDCDYIVTERTVMDWYIYYVWTCKNVGVAPDKHVTNLVMSWIDTYDVLFFMDSEGIDYVNDGFRPASTRIRDEVVPEYKAMADTITAQNLNVKFARITDDDVRERTEHVLDIFSRWFLNHEVIRDTRK